MLLSEMIFTTDLDMVHKYLMDMRIKSIIVSDEGRLDGFINTHPGAVKASILLPPYEAVAFLLDNNYEAFTRTYCSYLSSYEVDVFITCIVKAMCGGSPVIMYTTEQENQMGWIGVLFEYLKQNFGIIPSINGTNIAFSYNPSYDMMLISKMYLYSLITPYWLFMQYPEGNPLPNEVIMKLARDLNPYVADQSFDSYKLYFEQLMYNTKHQGREVIVPAVRRNNQ